MVELNYIYEQFNHLKGDAFVFQVSVLGRRAADNFFENLGEIIIVAEANPLGYFGN